MTAPVTAPSPDPITDLPTWTDAPAVSAYLSSIIAFAVGIVALMHPGFHVPAVVQALVPSVGIIIAGAVTALHVFSHRSVQKAAIVARTAKS